MIRVTVECDGSKGTSELADGCTLNEAVEAFEGALRAATFCFKGRFELTEDE